MSRFTANDARRGNWDELDGRIRAAVSDCGYADNGNYFAYVRIYHDDAFRYDIASELEARGFVNIDVPSITLKGDVYFEWEA